MALDEWLLDWVRQLPDLTLVVRTYQWQRPTLSLGVNQPAKDIPRLLLEHPLDTHDWVRRPTGGRAILHGQDIAFSFVCNDPALLKQPLKNSYCQLTGLLKHALNTCAIPLQDSCKENPGAISDKSYLRSSLCFETQTPSDVLDAHGQKIAGCAQLRRQGGILQHGSAFISAYNVSETRLAQALWQAASKQYHVPVKSFHLQETDLRTFHALMDAYQREVRSLSQSMVASTATTSGSHSVPASF